MADGPKSGEPGESVARELTNILGTVNYRMTKLYPYIGYIGGMLVVSLFIISLINMLMFIYDEGSQSLALGMYPNLLNKDSMEFLLLHYAKGSREKESYNIKPSITISIIMFWFIAIVFLYVVVHQLVGFFDKTPLVVDLAKLKGPVEQNKDNRPFFSVLAVFALAWIFSGYYDIRFSRQITPLITEISAEIKNINELIYDSLSTDETFLKNVVNENNTECYIMINRQGDRAEKIGSMIFTMSLFSYLKLNTDRIGLENLKKIFTPTQIRSRKISIFDYLYHNRNIFIGNLYEKTEPNIKYVLNTYAKKSAVRQNVKERLDNINRRCIAMFRISPVRSDVRAYIIMSFIISLIFFIITCLIYAEQLTSITKKYIMPFFSIFTNKK